jgi:1-acyl-sn-glycerol-3-phosphate acyltransferase
MRPSSFVLTGLAKLLVGAFPRWIGCGPEPTQRIYFANHTSHIDTVAIWAALPVRLRNITHPVAAKDYWGSGVRRYIATKILRAVLIDRSRSEANANPLAPLIEMLQLGESLIIFPEGTRGVAAIPGPFKSGLYRLAEQFPNAQLVPVYLENVYRSMPKGAVLPLPITCTVRFGTPMWLAANETKEAFLERARGEIIKLAGDVGVTG